VAFRTIMLLLVLRSVGASGWGGKERAAAEKEEERRLRPTSQAQYPNKGSPSKTDASLVCIEVGGLPRRAGEGSARREHEATSSRPALALSCLSVGYLWGNRRQCFAIRRGRFCSLE
jgi:hypothetical protein